MGCVGDAGRTLVYCGLMVLEIVELENFDAGLATAAVLCAQEVVVTAAAAFTQPALGSYTALRHRIRLLRCTISQRELFIVLLNRKLHKFETYILAHEVILSKFGFFILFEWRSHR